MSTERAEHLVANSRERASKAAAEFLAADRHLKTVGIAACIAAALLPLSLLTRNLWIIELAVAQLLVLWLVQYIVFQIFRRSALHCGFLQGTNQEIEILVHVAQKASQDRVNSTDGRESDSGRSQTGK